MQEYFNIDVESNFSLEKPQEINNRQGEAALLKSSFQDGDSSLGPITIMTPRSSAAASLFCSSSSSVNTAILRILDSARLALRLWISPSKCSAA